MFEFSNHGQVHYLLKSDYSTFGLIPSKFVRQVVIHILPHDHQGMIERLKDENRHSHSGANYASEPHSYLVSAYRHLLEIKRSAGFRLDPIIIRFRLSHQKIRLKAVVPIIYFLRTKHFKINIRSRLERDEQRNKSPFVHDFTWLSEYSQEECLQ